MKIDMWRIYCIKDFEASNYVKFEAGHYYHVKDKFPGPDGTVETGIWEVKDGHGGLVNIDQEARNTYFKCYCN